MLIGIIVLAAIAVLFFLGKAKKITTYFGNDFVALILILFVIIGNLIPPYTFRNSAVYFGGIFLAVIALLLTFVKVTGGERLLTVAGSLLLGIGVFLFNFFVLAPSTISPIFGYMLLVLLGGIIGYIIGKTPISVFIITYLGFFLASLVQFVFAIKVVNGGIITNYLGGGAPFSIAICATTLAVGLNVFVSYLARKTQAKTYIFNGEASDELGNKEDLKSKETKKRKK